MLLSLPCSFHVYYEWMTIDAIGTQIIPIIVFINLDPEEFLEFYLASPLYFQVAVCMDRQQTCKAHIH